MNCYDKLEAACLPLIQHYHEDLTKWDRQWIDANPDCRFLHWTSDFGTHFVALIDPSEYPAKDVEVPYLFGTAGREHLLREVLSMAERFTFGCNSPERFTVHYFDGRHTLRLIDVRKAVEIARQYVWQVEQAWKPVVRREAVPA